MSINGNPPGSGAGSGPKRAPPTTATRTASQQQRRSRPWFSTPAPVRRLFTNFPLQTLPAESLPACPHDAERTLQSSPPDEEDLPVLHIFSHPSDARRGAPSFNPSCLQYQAWFRVHGVRTRCVVSSNHAAPDGALPFVVSARKRGPVRTGQHENGKTKGGREQTAAEAGDNGVGVSTGTIKESLGIAGRLSGSADKLDARDVPIRSGKLWHWAAQQAGRESSITGVQGNSMQQAREKAYTSLVEHRLRAAWVRAGGLETTLANSFSSSLST
jgi:hypothetical protein